MRRLWQWWRRLWCEWMHDAPMWPVNGRYRCRVCQMEWEVGWEDPQEESFVEERENEVELV